MAHKSKDILCKDDVVQAIVVGDTFSDDFIPISNEIPLALFPVLNKPLIDYTLEFLSQGGIEETFLFCCSHADAIKTHINQSLKDGASWSFTMKVNLIISDSCRSFGDCLRDLDQKGLLRGNFVLLEPGTISNIKLLPLIKKHNEIANKDKGAAMTLIFQEAGLGQLGNDPSGEVVVAVNNQNRIVFHRKSQSRKVKFPLEVFLENNLVSLRHNLKDTHIAVCSPSVLSLFSDNFDFQTKDDFVKGLLMNEEILGSTVYCHVVKGAGFGGAVSNWRMYQAISKELHHKWLYPLQMLTTNKIVRTNLVGEHARLEDSKHIFKSVIGQNVRIGKNCHITDSFIFPNTKISNDVVISHSVIGPNCHLKPKSKITSGSILGKGVVVESGKLIENILVQAKEPKCFDSKDKLGKHAFRIKIPDNDDGNDVAYQLSRKLRHLQIEDPSKDESDDDAFTDSEDEDSQSSIPDDAKFFFTEVIDSLTRGFEDELLCDNLIVEINSSRYAYNVTVNEVSFYVMKAVFLLSLKPPIGPQYFSQFQRLLSYFVPVFKKYISNQVAMIDTLEAIEDVAVSNENVNEKWVRFVLSWFYEKDFIGEDAILEWFQALDEESGFYNHVKPFVDWLEEAEEASSSEED